MSLVIIIPKLVSKVKSRLLQHHALKNKETDHMFTRFRSKDS